MESELIDLDATATLARAEREVAARRQQGVERLLLLQHWADLHAEDPQARPGAVPISRGGDRLVRLGGDGTPQASELCWAELAIALATGAIALRNQAGQALDLRHRLPLLWALLKELRVEPWVAQKVATMTRPLTREQVALVDAAVAEAADESPGRILAIAEAKTIEADLEGYRARLAEDARRTGVWLSRPRPGDLVEEQGDPHAAASLLDQMDAPPSADDEEQPDPPRPKKRRPATLLVHLSDLVLFGHADGLARVEGMGPMLFEQVADLLRHREVTVQPVIDLNTGHSVNGYEHPTQVKLRTRLRTVHDVFPHSSSRATSRLDHDHPTPYDPGGPPGQTGDHNDAPLTRFHHRAKTHDGYQVCQLGLGAYRWVTPHGLARVVTPRGTRKVELVHARDGTIIGEIYPGTRLDYPRSS